jgi:hypothetical protein
MAIWHYGFEEEAILNPDPPQAENLTGNHCIIHKAPACNTLEC